MSACSIHSTSFFFQTSSNTKWFEWWTVNQTFTCDLMMMVSVPEIHCREFQAMTVVHTAGAVALPADQLTKTERESRQSQPPCLAWTEDIPKRGAGMDDHVVQSQVIWKQVRFKSSVKSSERLHLFFEKMVCPFSEVLQNNFNSLSR